MCNANCASDEAISLVRFFFREFPVGGSREGFFIFCCGGKSGESRHSLFYDVAELRMTCDHLITPRRPDVTSSACNVAVSPRRQPKTLVAYSTPFLNIRKRREQRSEERKKRKEEDQYCLWELGGLLGVINENDVRICSTDRK